jgi:hypothetical protein
VGPVFESEHVEEVVETLFGCPMQALEELVAVGVGRRAEDDSRLETASSGNTRECVHSRRVPAALPAGDGGLSCPDTPGKLGLRKSGASARFPNEIVGTHH